MISKLRTKEFKTLQREWYKKLKDSGFKEIEDTSSPLEMLKTWHSSYFINRNTPDTFLAKQSYFQSASRFLHSNKFKSEKDRLIWEMHCDGATLRGIASELKEKLWFVHRTVNNLILKMQLSSKSARQ